MMNSKLAVMVPSVAILLPLLILFWPSIREEFVLQFQCHLNDTHLAQENIRLRRRLDKLQNEFDAVSEEKKQCLNDNDIKHCAASRSFWTGVTMCICAELLVAIYISLLVVCCCWCMNRFHAPQAPPAPQMQHSAAKSFWTGVTMCICAELAVITLLFFCWNRFHFPQAPQAPQIN